MESATLGKDLPMPVVVEWIDSCTSSEEDLRDIEDEKELLMFSCGFLIGRNPWGLVLSTDYYPAELKDGKKYRYYSFIPDEMVRHIYYGDEFDRGRASEASDALAPKGL